MELTRGLLAGVLAEELDVSLAGGAEEDSEVDISFDFWDLACQEKQTLITTNYAILNIPCRMHV